jgi:protein gp37
MRRRPEVSATTHISWTQSTWNVVSGCTRVSEGCDHCYIERTPPFRMAGRRFDKPGVGGTTGVVLHPDRLTQPLRWRKPRMVFVNSLSDLFHDDIPDDYIARVFAVMAATPRHTYQILTKRPARMRSLLAGAAVNGFQSAMAEAMLRDTPKRGAVVWPLPNVWLGVSVENQKWANVRVPLLTQTPAAIGFLSCEPLLGEIDLRAAVGHYRRITGIDWVIVGGESGAGARRMDPEWAVDLRDQCRSAGVAYWFKQTGAVLARDWRLNHRAGADPGEWPPGMPQEWPKTARHAVQAAPGDAATLFGGVGAARGV